MNTKVNNYKLILFSILAISLFTIKDNRAQKPVKIFILAGQSNMQGHGETVKGDRGNLSWLINSDKSEKYQHLINQDGSWSEREDVYIYSTDKFDNKRSGKLSVGHGAFDYTIGPELQFGNLVGDYYDEDVLIIKTCWGGKSLAVDFCPPSAVSDSGYVKIPYAPKDTGYYYVNMLSTIYDVLHNIDKYVPNYSGQGYQIEGFAWHQGWNDRVNEKHTAAYESNLAHLIGDIRNDLGEPNLPFVLATTGMRSYKENDPKEIALIKAQKSITNHSEFKESVKVVDTQKFWRSIEESPAKQNYHWNRNAESYCLIGESLGKAMLELVSKSTPKVRFATINRDLLAPKPPMGWNSWNAFEKDIDENKIKSIADIMVSSGMRDAGYEYLVLDDAWMDSIRSESGQLMADPIKFPGGMKAIGDYIHSKGLRFGIYECRGHVTCQNLPGSFEYEQIDMKSFASWGVDYIKMDACFAAKNGRLSSDDFAIYADAVKKSGRPMVFSISDFGQGAWAWGGKEYAQLWRTSMDIYPYIKSVYKCAETSGGSGSSHPEFNGLWQFSGPGHWNDPDMLQIGNLRTPAEDKVHFSLWAIISAPLMAGNDLREMSDYIKNILTAPEVIAINQDDRLQQGYQVYNKDSIEIYNKPLSDGTTAVLLLNKGTKRSDVTIKWNQVGLKGSQEVRDLWKREDLGLYKNSFTASQLGQHEHMLIKVGTVGSEQIPGPTPLAVDRYTLTKKGTTYLSDICYIMKEGNHAISDKSFQGDKIEVDGKKYRKGLGCKSKSIAMYKLDHKASRFKAIVSLDELSDDKKTGKFRVLNEDKFGGEVLYTSDNLKKGETKEIDIDVSDIDFLYLEFTGKGGVFGNWADAKVIVE